MDDEGGITGDGKSLMIEVKDVEGYN